MSVASNLNQGPFYIYILKQPGYFWTIKGGSKKTGAVLVQQRPYSTKIKVEKLKIKEENEQYRALRVFPANDTSEILPTKPKRKKRIKLQRAPKLSSEKPQQFKLIPVQNGLFYKIKAVDSNLYLQSKDNANGSRIIQDKLDRTSSNVDHQLWQFQSLGTNVFRIKNKRSGKFLGVLRGFNNREMKTDGTPIVQQEWQDKAYFRFRLISVRTSMPITLKESHVTEDSEIEGPKGVAMVLAGVIVATAAYFYYRRSRPKDST